MSRHILRHPVDHKPRLIDFEGSSQRKSRTAPFAGKFEEEIGEVKYLLGLYMPISVGVDYSDRK